MKFVFLVCIVFFTSSVLRAQDAATASDKEAAYRRTVQQRAEKIVAALALSGDATKAAVTNSVADQYVALNTVYTVRDEKLKAAKESLTDKEALAARTKEIEEQTTAQTRQLHNAFLKTLSVHLTESQVDQIKDGMTYNVLNVTYGAMLDMIPSLKPAEKTQIMTWLIEARDHAMDAESSEKKHWWFGKYKGRINNYLAAQGYDLQKERADWQVRLKAREEQKKAAQAH